MKTIAISGMSTAITLGILMLSGIVNLNRKEPEQGHNCRYKAEAERHDPHCDSISREFYKLKYKM
jgi:hypothetical protein